MIEQNKIDPQHFLEKANASIKAYCTQLINPGKYPPKDVAIASATFVTIQNQKGILTNDHVIRDLKLNETHIVNVIDLDESLQPLSYFFIHRLGDSIDNSASVDMAFICLTEKSCNIVTEVLKKQFWDLDNIQAIDLVNRQNTMWIIWGYVYEGAECKKNPSLQRPSFHFKNARPYVVVPDFDNTEYIECDYGKAKVIIDKINCPIRTKEKMPSKFNGMSGAALWAIKFNTKANVQEVVLLGLATLYAPANKAEKLICHGPYALYRGFYPFASGAICARRLRLNESHFQ